MQELEIPEISLSKLDIGSEHFTAIEKVVKEPRPSRDYGENNSINKSVRRYKRAYILSKWVY